MLENYLDRLARANHRVLPTPVPLSPPRIVHAQLKSLRIDPLKIDVIDFLALSGCQLQVNIGRRNSALGRMASASQQLLLDLEFLEHAPDCILYLRQQGDTKLADILEDAQQKRQSSLTKQLYNAILAGDEWQAFWALPQTLGNYPDSVSGDPIDALYALAESAKQWLSGDYRAENSVFEGHLAALRSGDGGALLLAATHTDSVMMQANSVLQRDPNQLVCGDRRVPEQVAISETVINRFFIAEVQPWVARVYRRNQNLLAATAQLEQVLGDVLPPEYRRWQSQRDATLATLSKSPRQHVAQLKYYFSGCPGRLWETASSTG